mmetsp:Transcript_23967/g.58177  ORF Transcript_23967/g.58177 Transcript_23967/m.58177 type:complete len:470 (-) Transcript_23967:119-1528(-)
MSTSTERYISEFVGTYLLVFTVGCNVLSGSGAFAALSIASVLMVSIYALGGVSGGHFNPAVSFALGLKVPGTWVEMGIYSLVQFVGGLAAAFSYLGVFNQSFNLAPGAGFGFAHVAVVETLFTFVLVFTVLNCAATVGYENKKQDNQFYGLAIGFTILVGGSAGGFITGGAFNPAVALAIDVSSMHLGFGWCAIYIAFQLLGAAIAYGAFVAVRPRETPGTPDGPSSSGPQEATLVSKCIAEFIGTYVLVVTVGLNVVQGGSNVAAVLSIGAALLVMVYSLGDVSGAHFNPAVTAAVVCAKKMNSLGVAAAYVASQVFGGILAGVTFWAITGKSFALGPAPGYGWASVAAAEFTFTFLLCFVVLSVACLRKVELTNFFGLAIGFAVIVGGYAIGGISGGALNPGVSVGVDFANFLNTGRFGTSIVYSIIQLAAGVVAALVFYITRGAEFEPQKELGPTYGATFQERANA